MTKDRRAFLKKSLAAGAVAGATAAAANKLANCATTLSDDCATEPSSSGVICGKAVKKEVLYKKNTLWEQYYSIAH
ncbi:MAG: Tat pathway signal protein [Campylobacteraceae bacterium]|jgi:hypothetical protein|nr:Tat pathway signal protein [Campylobacteraceae bacterium]